MKSRRASSSDLNYTSIPVASCDKKFTRVSGSAQLLHNWTKTAFEKACNQWLSLKVIQSCQKWRYSIDHSYDFLLVICSTHVSDMRSFPRYNVLPRYQRVKDGRTDSTAIAASRSA